MARVTRSRSNGSRRKLIWARQPAIDFVVPLGSPQTVQVDLLANFEAAYGAGLIGCTVMRVRGQMAFDSATATTSVTAVLPIVAGILVTNSTIAPGVIAGPISDPYQDWMMYDSWYRNQGSEVVGGWPNTLVKEFDVKSMRKIDELGQRLIMSIQGHPGGVSYNGNLTVSVLVALP